jgi:hypothetical protein
MRAVASLGRHHDVRGRYGLAVDARLGVKAPDRPDTADERRFQHQLVARHDWSAKTRVVDPHEIEGRFAGRLHAGRLEGEHAGRLRHGLDDQHARHDGTAGEMPLEKRLVERHVLERHDLAAGRVLENTIDQQERIAMRQVAENSLEIQ